MNGDILGIPGLTFGGVGNWAIFAAVVVAIVRIIPQMAKLKVEENAGLRREFIDEMRQLRDEVTQLRTENDILRKEVRELHGVIDGMRRENLTSHIVTQRDALGDRELSPPMQRAVGKLDEIVGGPKP